jgi:hypothetical protein
MKKTSDYISADLTKTIAPLSLSTDSKSPVFHHNDIFIYPEDLLKTLSHTSSQPSYKSALQFYSSHHLPTPDYYADSDRLEDLIQNTIEDEPIPSTKLVSGIDQYSSA